MCFNSFRSCCRQAQCEKYKGCKILFCYQISCLLSLSTEFLQYQSREFFCTLIIYSRCLHLSGSHKLLSCIFQLNFGIKYRTKNLATEICLMIAVLQQKPQEFRRCFRNDFKDFGKHHE